MNDRQDLAGRDKTALFLNCPRCGLSIKPTARWLAPNSAGIGTLDCRVPHDDRKRGEPLAGDVARGALLGRQLDRERPEASDDKSDRVIRAFRAEQGSACRFARGLVVRAE